ncbi:DUF5591 domain-containing protein [Methanosarcinaceae archaeon]|nr:DUF5591 domain-containing protein [Methanosarcinaceae archaeon]
MTQFFEVTERDGAGRIGSLRLSVPLTTPCLIDSEKTAENTDGQGDYPVFNAGAFWRGPFDDSGKIRDAVEKMKKCPDGTLLILPQAGYTLYYDGADEDRKTEKIMEAVREADLLRTRPTAKTIRPRRAVRSASSVSGSEETDPAGNPEGDGCEDASGCLSGSACSSQTSISGSAGSSSVPGLRETDPCDVFIMEGAGTLENDPFRFFDAVMDIRSRIPFDSALWLPKIAAPENVAVFAYLGADIFDTTSAVICAYDDRYMTPAGTFRLEDMTELPCRCAVCAGKSAKDILGLDKTSRAEHLKRHNINALEAELALVREKIRSGHLREYVEGQCRTRPWLTGLLRFFDRSPVSEMTAAAFRRTTMLATTSESQTRAEIRRFAERVCERCIPPEKDILIIFPCASKKPYSLSDSHQRFLRAVGSNRRFVNEIIITSPLGVVPRELELTYPAAHYDTTVTGHWDLEERAWVGSLLKKYLAKRSYKAIIAHVEGPYREICEDVCAECGIEIIFTSGRSPASASSLQTLKKALDDIIRRPENTGPDGKPSLAKRSYEKEKVDQLHAIARYQLGEIADVLFTEKTSVKGNFPKMQLFFEKTPLGTLVPQFGQIAFTLKAAEMIVTSPAYHGQYTVTISDFLPKGSLLAPGVIDADPQIRPGDEVIVKGPHALGIGKAFMAGPEMGPATKGVAALPRHTKAI